MFYFRNFNAIPKFDAMHVIMILLTLVAVTTLIMWLGELINLHGIGNGISLLIFASIVSRIPGQLISLFRLQTLNIVYLVVIAALAVGIIMGIIEMQQGERRIPVQYAKRIVGNKQYGGVRQYIPLKVNAAGVTPIIFAQAIMMVPITLIGFSKSDSLRGFAAAVTNINGIWYNSIEFLLVVAFTPRAAACRQCARAA